MPITSKVKDTEAGFTLIELLMAMAIFSFMLMIVVIGFINVVHIHNQAVAANIAEDNARTAMDELVRAVRTSNGVLPSAANTLCLTNTSSGGETIYYVAHPFPLTPLVGVLTRANSPRVLGTPNCVVPGTSPQAITSSIVSVTAFSGVVPPGNILKPEVNLTLTVASNNGTTTGSGANVACGPTNYDRNYCSAITLKSGAVPR